MDRPRVSVIIPHYRDLARLDRCLGLLEQQSFPRDAFEVVVADNASPEGEAVVAETIAGRGRLVVVHEPGAGPARNGGVAAARGEILAFTDCDCLPDRDWIAQGVQALERWDVVGGRVKVLVEDPAQVTPEEAFEQVLAFDNRSYVLRKGFTVTANLFCRAELFRRVGGFRVAVSEDLEWSRRATAAGFRIGFAEGAVVGHPARRNWQELKGKWRRLNAESFGLYAARPGGRVRWIARGLILPLTALVHTPKVLFSRKLSRPAQSFGALAVLYRLRLWRCLDALRLGLGVSRPHEGRSGRRRRARTIARRSSPTPRPSSSP